MKKKFFEIPFICVIEVSSDEIVCTSGITPIDTIDSVNDITNVEDIF